MTKPEMQQEICKHNGKPVGNRDDDESYCTCGPCMKSRVNSFDYVAGPSIKVSNH